MLAGLNLRNCKDAMFEHLSVRKRHILVLCFVFCVGLITGAITISQLVKTLSVSNITDLLLVESFSGKISIFNFFLKRFFDFFVITTIVVCISFWFITCFGIYPLMFFRGYQIGVTIAVCCVLYGAGGVLNIFLIYMPIQLTQNFVLVNCCSICCHQAWEKRRFGNGFKRSYNFLIIFLVLFLILCLFESLLIPTIFKKILIAI